MILFSEMRAEAAVVVTFAAVMETFCKDRIPPGSAGRRISRFLLKKRILSDPDLPLIVI